MRLVKIGDVFKLNNELKNHIRNRLVGSVGIVIAVVVALLVFIFCVYKVSPGYSAVVYNMDGGLEDEVLGQGYHFLVPWKKATPYPISTESVFYKKADGEKDKDTSINIATKDGKQVNVSVTYTYHMDADRLPQVFAKFRGQPIDKIEAGYMKSELLRVINEVTSQYNLMAIVGESRTEINQRVFDGFNKALSDCGIVIETMNISDAVPDQATAEAIQNVINSQNALEKAKIDKQTAEQEAEKRIVEAKGKAESVRIEAEAQAKANELLERSLTDNIIKNRAIDKWDGKSMPQVMGNGGMLFNIPIGDNK